MVPRACSLTARNLLLAVLFYNLAFAEAEAAGRWLQAITPSPTVGAVTDDPERTATPSITPTSSPAPVPSDTQTQSPTTSPSPSMPPTASATMTPTATPTLTETAEATSTSTLTTTPSPTSTPPPTPTQPNGDYPVGSVLINELAWAGTTASAHDEWIELHNPGPEPISLEGWRLTDQGDINIHLAGTIAPFSFFLLERTDDTTISSIGADLIYTGSMRNSGEILQLLSPSGNRIDSANLAGGGWPAGESGTRATMERLGGDDIPGNWVTFAGVGFAHDRDGNLINGTPRTTNSAFIPTATPTPTPATTPTPTMTAVASGSVLINEVAWAGTRASSSDEWIELHNTGPDPIPLDGWKLSDGGDLNITLAGELPTFGYFLLERSDDTTISNLTADIIYSGSLRNSGETLELLDSSGGLVDSANRGGGSWPAGDSSTRASMERRGGADRSGNWGTFTGYGGVGLDAAGNTIQGTPKSKNSVLIPTPTPTWIPGSVVINEVLIRPHYDWEGTGGVTTGDEFIELFNRGPGDVWLRGWFLDDVSGSGSKPFALPGVTISEHGYAVFFRSKTHIALNDGGDSVRLLAPDGRMIDKLHYERVRAYNLSYGRLPNGSNELVYGLWPTPGEANMLFIEPGVQDPIWPARPAYACPDGGRLHSFLPRHDRKPWHSRWMFYLGLSICD